MNIHSTGCVACSFANVYWSKIKLLDPWGQEFICLFISWVDDGILPFSYIALKSDDEEVSEEYLDQELDLLYDAPWVAISGEEDPGELHKEILEKELGGYTPEWFIKFFSW